MKKIISLLAALCLMGASVALAEEAKPFADNKEIDLLTILPPPPANDSVQTKAELAEILTFQVTRTPEMAARADADATENVWRFADVMGPSFTKEKLPKFAAFFDRVTETEGAVVDPAKDVFNRPRPHQLSDLVKPAVKMSNSGAWPSGHSTVGVLMGIVLSNMVPEKRAEIMARAWEFGANRVVAGMHFPSDIEAGRIAGTAIAVELPRHDDFQAEFEAARKEIRAALGLGA